MIGRRIGSWVLERELGHGGMGTVFEARHVSLGRRAAVKMLSAGLESAATFRERFDREAKLQAQLQHPNVARVLDYLEDGGAWFLVVDYLERGSLADLLHRGEVVSRDRALAWARQALAGLGHAHQKGIVHRDVKPANLLIGGNDEIVVADFGIARASNAAGLTASGVSVGTPHYMSPEQIRTPHLVDGRSDIYSIGVVVYELLAGRRPFDGQSEFTVMQAHVMEPPPPLREVRPDVPAAVEAVVMRALAKRPEDRYADCASMAQSLEEALVGTVSVPRIAYVPPAAGGTVHASRLYDKVQPGPAAGTSPGDQRERKRSSYQTRLASGVVATLLLAALFAYHVAGKGSNKDSENLSETTPDTGATTTTSNSTIDVPGRKPDPFSKKIRPPKKAPGGPQAPVDPGPKVPPPVTETVAAPPIPVPTPPQMALPERPRVAVVGTGDPLLAGALELEMERRLDQFDVADEQGEPEIEELVASKGAKVPAKELGAALLKNGFQILVLIRVEEAERRTKTIEGITGNLKAARMRLNAYLLPANRTIGSGWTEPAEYTELSAVTIAKQAFIGPSADLRAAIERDWAQLKSGGGRP